MTKNEEEKKNQIHFLSLVFVHGAICLAFRNIQKPSKSLCFFFSGGIICVAMFFQRG